MIRRGMSIRELYDRLGTIVESAAPTPNILDLPIVIRIARGPRRTDHYVPLDYPAAAPTTLGLADGDGGPHRCFLIVAHERDMVKPARRNPPARRPTR
jgi:hypothetical protein